MVLMEPMANDRFSSCPSERPARERAADAREAESAWPVSNPDKAERALALDFTKTWPNCLALMCGLATMAATAMGRPPWALLTFAYSALAGSSLAFSMAMRTAGGMSVGTPAVLCWLPERHCRFLLLA